MSHDRPSICTASGVEFSPFDPRPADIRIADIAHALAVIPRFGGHTFDPYSVAQHSIRVCMVIRDGGWPIEVQRMALLHDASEAYLGDMPGPLKRAPELAGYLTAESRLQTVIYRRYGIDADHERAYGRAVKDADALMLAVEQRDLMPDCDLWTKPEAAGTPKIVPFHHEFAREAFLHGAEVVGISDQIEPLELTADERDALAWQPPPTELCAPRDSQERIWMLVFDDPSRMPRTFGGHGAEAAARKAWAEASQSWHCTLLTTVQR